MLTQSTAQINAQVDQMHLTCGTLLELGPGRVWPGLDLLRREAELELVGMGFSEPERLEALARAGKQGILSRVNFPVGDLTRLPLPDRSVDGVLSFGGLHRWSQPLRVLDEIARVIKIGGPVFLGDARRDMNWLTGALKSRIGLAALQAVYRERDRSLTAGELQELCGYSRLRNGRVVTLGPDLWLQAEG